MTVTKVVDEEKKDRRQKRAIIALFVVCMGGFSYIFYDYFNIVNRTTIPEDLGQVNQTITGWQSNGLIASFDVTQAKLVVNEDKWNGMTKAEKVGIVTQLARYCADSKKQDLWRFEVVGNRSSSVVGELGARGLMIQ